VSEGLNSWRYYKLKCSLPVLKIKRDKPVLDYPVFGIDDCAGG
jgi:hypothetical protein